MSEKVSTYLKLFKLVEWTQLIKKFHPFQEILVQSNKAVLDFSQAALVIPPMRVKRNETSHKIGKACSMFWPCKSINIYLYITTSMQGKDG